MLKQCEFCKKEVSCLADNCPSCGGPNSWLHPKITEFLEGKDKTGVSKPFDFYHNKIELWGETKSSLSVNGWLLMAGVIFGVFVSFSIYGFNGAIIGGVVAGVLYQVILLKFNSQESFKVNFKLDTGFLLMKSFGCLLKKV